jgi:hypothetical protein
MNTIKHFILPLLIAFYIGGCANTSVVILNESDKFAPSNSVQILQNIPNESYKVIARLETRGAVGQGIPELLKDMRKKAKEIGADAIIPTEEGKEKVEQGIFYNPWLGGYQTIGGGNQPIVKGYAIVFKKSIPQKKAAYRPPSIVNGGVSFNLLTPTLGGYGINAWIGKNKFRVVGDYYSIEIPSSLGGDGFVDGKVESAIRVGADYFFTGDLNGLYFGSGIQSGSYSFLNEKSNVRGKWKTLDFTISIGYKLNFVSNFDLDTRLGIDAIMFGGEEKDIGGQSFIPLEGKPYASIGLGVHF